METAVGKKVFATSWHPGGAKAILPVIKQLINDGKVELAIVGHGFSEPIFSEAGITFKTIKDFDISDVSAESMEKLLKTTSPNMVLIGTAGQEGNKNDVIEQTVTVAAKKLGTPSLAVLDYWANYWQRFSDERTGRRLDLLPNKIAIMDEVAKKDMLEEGFLEETLVITGNPHFDDLAEKAKNFTKEQRRKIREEIGFSPGTLFFFACNMPSFRKPTSGYWDLDVIKLIAKSLSIWLGIRVAIRLHPRTPEEDKQEVRDYVASLKNIKLDEDPNPQKSQILALAADLTIVEDSTMAIEAVLMGRPCISLQPGLLVEDSLIISKKGIIPVGYSEKDCLGLLTDSTNHDFREEIVKKYVGFTTDGKATERVVQLVYSMLGQ